MGEEREDDDIQIIEQSPENRGKLRDILQQKGDLSDPKPKIPIMKKRASHITNQVRTETNLWILLVAIER